MVNLKIHIERGCLSRFPPGGGSTRNENLHKNLGAVIARSKLGCELAEALLSTFFYTWNERRNASSTTPSRCVKPILSYRAELEEHGFVPTSERFGIIPQSTELENSGVTTHVTLKSCGVFCAVLCQVIAQLHVRKKPSPTMS